MKYVITGSLGNISKPLAQQLIAAGHSVTIITSKEENKTAIAALGATAAVGSVEDTGFLEQAFSGADAVYTMVPPNMVATEWKKWIGTIGKNYADAIKANGIKYVVNLSSVGAHLQDGCGPVSGLYKVEAALNALEGVHVKHLRPSYFFHNLLANVGLLKHAGIVGSNFGGANFKMVLVDTKDIAAAAFEELSNVNFTDKSVRYIASDEVSTDEIAVALGSAVGKPATPWVVFTNEQAKEGMLQAGLSQEITENYVEMGTALQSGIMMEDYWKNHPATLGKTKLKDFATVFANVYNAN